MVLNENSQALIQTWQNKKEYQRFKMICPKCGNENNFDNNEIIYGLFNTDLILSEEIAIITYTCYHCKETMDFNLSRFNISQEIVMKLFLKNKDFVLAKLFDDKEFIQELNNIFHKKIYVPKTEMVESVEFLIESFDAKEYEDFNNKTKEELVVYGMQVLHKYIDKILTENKK